MIEALVVGSHLRWRGVWQRPNHIVSRLARSMPVLVVEEPLAGPLDRNVTYASDRLTVLVPQRVATTDAVDDRTLADVRVFAGTRNAALWLYSPLLLGLADALPGAPIVYDKMDELANFAKADARIVERERALLGRASVVFAGGRSLWESVAARARAGRAFPSGVDVEHYRGAAAKRRHGERPTFGYVGVIDERLDLGLIAALGAARPDATIDLVGPVAKIERSSLPRAANIRYLGKRAYDELPGLIAGFDVALMPFARNDATRYISPTKTLEYLAAGRPVVSTAIADVIADYADVVRIADDAPAFIAAVAEAERDDDARRQRGVEIAARHTWDDVFAGMRAELARNGLTFSAALEEARASR